MEKHAKALQEIKDMDKPTITPAQAARVLGWDPHYIRVAAQRNPDMLPFPVFRKGDHYGARTVIPRLPFIRYVEQGA